MTEMLSTLRQTRRSVWLLSAVVVVLVGGLAITSMTSFASPTRPTLTTSGSSNGGTAQVNLPKLIVTGSSPAGLAPGVTKAVTIHIRNPHQTHVVITTASLKVGDASKACTAAANVRTTRYRSTAPGAKTYVVYGNHQVRIPLKLTMLNLATNQDACKGAKFPLTYLATGRKG